MKYFGWGVVSVILLFAAYCATLPIFLVLDGLCRKLRGNPRTDGFSFLPGVAILVIVLGSPLYSQAPLARKIAFVLLVLDLFVLLPILATLIWKELLEPRLKRLPK